MTEKERMLAGLLYRGGGPELKHDMARARKLTTMFNTAPETSKDLLRELFGSIGNNCHIEAPFRCDYGSNIYIGDDFYANYDCIILDVCRVDIGNNVMFAPRVSILAATHPLDPDIRAEGLEYGAPISIGDKVWLGAGVIVNPGVKIGAGSVIGSGSVVTKDIPPNCLAVGNPCRVLREISEDERQHWQKLRADYLKNLAG